MKVMIKTQKKMSGVPGKDTHLGRRTRGARGCWVGPPEAKIWRCRRKHRHVKTYSKFGPYPLFYPLLTAVVLTLTRISQARGHRTGSSHSGAEEYPTEKKHRQAKSGTTRSFYHTS